MKFEPIIVSLLDTDLYKFNMNQVIFHKYNSHYGEYHFKCRNPEVKFTQEMVDEIKEQIHHLCTLRFTNDEIEYLKGIRFLKRGYIEFLRFWTPIEDYVTVELSDDGKLSIIVSGPMFACMPFEIYILEIVNEVYFRTEYNYEDLWKSADIRLTEKIKKFNSHFYCFNFTDFGGRRRMGREWQEHVLNRFISETTGVVTGTSNVYLAMKLGLKPMGTYAHEYVQMYQGFLKINPAYSNFYAMTDWYEEYDGDNGIALTDTITTDAFLLDFNYANARTFTGVRHDSGDPFEWGDKIIKHYEKLGIDPTTKTLLFSDSLDFDKAQRLYNYFNGRAKVGFGIGTFVMNDSGEEPLNIVLKLQRVDGNPVAKLSDVDGKTMSLDDGYVAYLKKSIKCRISQSNNFEL